MDLSGLVKAANAQPSTPDTLTALVVRADESGLWVVPLGDDPRHPIGPCLGGWTADGGLAPPGSRVALTYTLDDPWVVALADRAFAVNDSTLAPFRNPSFELLDLADPTQPAGWSDFWTVPPRGSGPGTYTRALDDTTTAGGIRSLRVEARGVACLNESGDWPVNPGASVEITVYARASGVTPVVRAILWSNTAGLYAGPFAVGAIPNDVLEWVPGNDWQRFRGVVTIPPTHSKINLFVETGSSSVGTATVWIDNVDVDLVDLNPATEHQDFIRRATATMSGGGIRTVTAGGNVSWSQALTIAAAGRGPTEAPDGRFEIGFPTGGAVIPVRQSSGRVSYTVAGGVIALSPDEALWYELPLDEPAASQPGRFRIIGTTSDDVFVVPPHWVLIVRRCAWSSTNHAPEYVWGDAVKQDPWRTPSFNAGWIAGTVTPRFAKTGDGEVRMKGRVRSGSGAAFTLPPGYCPAETHTAFVRDGAGASALLTVTSAGVVTTAGSNSDHSIETTFVAEQ